MLSKHTSTPGLVAGLTQWACSVMACVQLFLKSLLSAQPMSKHNRKHTHSTLPVNLSMPEGPTPKKEESKKQLPGKPVAPWAALEYDGLFLWPQLDCPGLLYQYATIAATTLTKRSLRSTIVRQKTHTVDSGICVTHGLGTFPKIPGHYYRK